MVAEPVPISAQSAEDSILRRGRKGLQCDVGRTVSKQASHLPDRPPALGKFLFKKMKPRNSNISRLFGNVGSVDCRVLWWGLGGGVLVVFIPLLEIENILNCVHE